MTGSTTLLDLQQAFSHMLFNAMDAGSSLALQGNTSATKKHRLDIYRNNMFFSLTRALGELYPVTRQLAGDGYFYTAARQYLQENPPTQAAIVRQGSGFPGFLQCYQYAQGYEWFADMARLELAWHESYHAKDMAPIGPESLQGLDPGQLAASRAEFHPSFRLIQSDIPLYRIWALHQQDMLPNELPGLGDGAETVMLVRPQMEVNVTLIQPETGLFLSSLRQGRTLQEAMITVAETIQGCKPEHILATLLVSGIFVAFKGESG